MARMEKPTAPKGCKLVQGSHTTKKTADSKAKRMRESGRKITVLKKQMNGKTKYFLADCGKRKR